MRVIAATLALLLLVLSPFIWRVPGRADEGPVYQQRPGIDPNFSFAGIETSVTLDGRILIVRARKAGVGASGEAMLSLSRALVLTEVEITDPLAADEKVRAESAILESGQVWIVGNYVIELAGVEEQGFTTRSGLVLEEGRLGVAAPR